MEMSAAPLRGSKSCLMPGPSQSVATKRGVVEVEKEAVKVDGWWCSLEVKGQCSLSYNR